MIRIPTLLFFKPNIYLSSLNWQHLLITMFSCCINTNFYNGNSIYQICVSLQCITRTKIYDIYQSICTAFIHFYVEKVCAGSSTMFLNRAHSLMTIGRQHYLPITPTGFVRIRVVLLAMFRNYTRILTVTMSNKQ